MISRAEIEAAHGRIARHIRRTPVLALEPGALGPEAQLTLKLEHLQATGSFKVRGAFNNLLSREIPEAGIVAISGGNHGAAVALAATRLGVRSTVYVPGSIAVEVKLARMRGFGAEVVVVPGNIDAAFEAYRDHAERTGALEVHPYDSEPTLAGQGTVAREIAEQAQIDTLFVSVGGGGLIGGILSWLRGDVKVIAVETEGTATLDRTLKEGRAVKVAASGLAASGLGASTVGALPMQAIERWLAGNIVVTDADIVAAQRKLWEATRIVGEPGAAVALAPLTAGAYAPAKDERVGILICGGNAEPDWFMD